MNEGNLADKVVVGNGLLNVKAAGLFDVDLGGASVDLDAGSELVELSGEAFFLLGTLDLSVLDDADDADLVDAEV